MKTNFTRRAFGVLTLGATAAALPGAGFAKAVEYAYPTVLINADALMRKAVSDTGTRTEQGEPGLVIVDVRSRDEFDAGHIIGAVHLDPNAVVAPYSPVDGALCPFPEIESLLGSLGVSSQSQVVFYDDKGGFHAARMLWLMEYFGHRNVAVLNGGWTFWKEVGGPIAETSEPLAATVFQAALSPRRYASAADVLEHRSEKDAVLIDVRPTPMYSEGHIPWAVNIRWARNLREDKRFRSAEELLAHFASFGVTPESNVIMHCQNGLASSHSYVALRLLGFSRIRVYHRYWAEWGNDPSLPRATS